jgi:hypothetical protein
MKLSVKKSSLTRLFLGLRGTLHQSRGQEADLSWFAPLRSWDSLATPQFGNRGGGALGGTPNRDSCPFAPFPFSLASPLVNEPLLLRTDRDRLEQTFPPES